MNVIYHEFGKNRNNLTKAELYQKLSMKEDHIKNLENLIEAMFASISSLSDIDKGGG